MAANKRESEPDWAEQARGSSQTFARLYDRYFPRLYAYITYRVGSIQDAEDLTAEVFLRVVRKFGQFERRHEGAFAAWLFRIAHNLVVDFHRRNGRPTASLSLEDLPEIPAASPHPEEAALQAEAFIRLRRMVATLAPRRQEVIALKFFGQLRNRDIAQILGLDERTVASHLCRGLKELHRKYMSETERNERAENSK